MLKSLGRKRTQISFIVQIVIYPASYTEFDKAVADACPDCTGAMFGAAVSHAKYIFKNGWDNYVQSILEARKKK